MRYLLSLLILSLSLVNGYAKEKVKVFVGEIEGPDRFIQERFEMLFMEELGKLKNVELVDSKEKAQYQLNGIGKVEYTQQSSISGSANKTTGAVISGHEGDTPNAILSVKLLDRNGSIAFVANMSKIGGGKGATHEAVIATVKEMKKRLKWK